MKVLIFGKNGQVGTELQRCFSENCQVLALSREDEGGDLTKLDALEKRIRSFAPTIVFNAAAYTAVDKAETERELARTVNVDAVRVMAKVCEEIKAVFVHYSTDYVFDGNGATQRTEEDVVAPLNYYGVTKLAGEEEIRSTNVKSLIFRTSWVYAEHGHNFIKTILRLAKTKEALNVVKDQVGAPTSAKLIAEVSAQLAVRAFQGEESLLGLYNLVPHGETNWCELARYVVSYAQRHGFKQNLLLENIKGIPTEEYPTPAKRPLNSRLSNEKLCRVYKGKIEDWRLYVDEVLESLMKMENSNEA